MNEMATSTGQLAAALQLQAEIGLRRRAEARTAFVEEFNRLLIEATGDCIIVIDALGQVLSLNKAAQGLRTGAREADPKHWTSLFPNLQTAPAFPLRSPRRTPAAFQAVTRGNHGETRYWSVNFTCFPSSLEGEERFLMVARDCTEHMLAELALRQSEEAFRKIFEANPIGILVMDLRNRITKANDAIGAMLGYSSAELAGMSLAEITACGSSSDCEEMARLLRGESRSFQTELVLQTKRQSQVWVHVTAAVLRGADGAPVSIFQMIENIQDRKSTEEQVLCYQQQLQTLASELALSEERERRRIATNLHDRIGQTLAFARLKLAGMAGEASSEELAKLRELIDQAIGDTRSLTFELSPPVLYELGLAAALEWLARKIAREHPIRTRFHDDGQPKPLHDNVRVVLFQSVRELLVNVVKHARASHAQVTMRRDADALRIVIEDDGVGFELAKVQPKREAARSFGLFNVRERLEYLGGRVKIRSEKGRGTRVTLIAPLRLEPKEAAMP